MIPRLRPADVKRISLCLILLISLLSGSTITAQPGDKVFGVEHFALMNQLSVAEKRFPRSEHDIAADFFALRKYYTGTRWTFDEGRNTFNPASHCDIAWAGALASYAHTERKGGIGAALILEDDTILHGEQILAAQNSEEDRVRAMMLSDDPRIWHRVG